MSPRVILWWTAAVLLHRPIVSVVSDLFDYGKDDPAGQGGMNLIPMESFWEAGFWVIVSATVGGIAGLMVMSYYRKLRSRAFRPRRKYRSKPLLRMLTQTNLCRSFHRNPHK